MTITGVFYGNLSERINRRAIRIVTKKVMENYIIFLGVLYCSSFLTIKLFLEVSRCGWRMFLHTCTLFFLLTTADFLSMKFSLSS